MWVVVWPHLLLHSLGGWLWLGGLDELCEQQGEEAVDEGLMHILLTA